MQYPMLWKFCNFDVLLTSPGCNLENYTQRDEGP